MDKTDDRKNNIINDKEVFVVDGSEFEMVQAFLNFIRGRERGVFTASIFTNKGSRCVKLDFTDQRMINLNRAGIDDGSNSI